MLNTLFEPTDNIEIRCLHKDQVMKKGKADPSPYLFFGTYKDHRNRAKELARLNNMGYNIYFGVNARQGNSKKSVKTCRSLCVDIDHMSADEAREWLDVVTNEWMVPFPTLRLSSGNGVHYYWRLTEELSTADWHKYQKALIATFNLTTTIADPVIHDPARIMRLPGFINHKGGRTAKVIQNSGSSHSIRDFEFILENLKLPPQPAAPVNSSYKGDNANALERALKYHELRDGVAEGNRNSECYKIAACCQNDFGLSESDAYHVISIWNQKNRPSLSEAEVRGVIAKAKPSNPNLSKDRPPMTSNPPLHHNPLPAHQDATMPMPRDPYQDLIPPDMDPPTAPKRSPTGANLDTLAYMLGNYVLVAGTTDIWDLDHGMLMPANALSLMFPAEFKLWKSDPNRRLILSENLVFEPSGAVANGQINTFRGFQFEADPRPMPALNAHLEMLCSEDTKLMEWVVSWMAHQVQFPGVKLATSIIMHGEPGTGKSMLWECFGKIFDPYFITIDQTMLESDFNSWASRKTFVLAEEVLANRSKSKLKNVIKQMITGGTIQINQKFSRPWTEKCYMNMVFLSNNHLPMLLDEKDRRFLVVRCDNIQPEDYYNNLATEIADNGPARLYHMLKTWDLSGFHAHTKPIMTEAKRELIHYVRDSCKNFIDEWAEGLIPELPYQAALKADLYTGYVAWCRQTGSRANSRNHLYRVVQEDYRHLLSEGRNRIQGRYYFIAGQDTSDYNLLHFREQLIRFIGKMQDQRI